MKPRKVMLNLEVDSTTPLNVLKKASSYKLVTYDKDRQVVGESIVLQAQVNVVVDDDLVDREVIKVTSKKKK